MSLGIKFDFLENKESNLIISSCSSGYNNKISQSKITSCHKQNKEYHVHRLQPLNCTNSPGWDFYRDLPS
jgi:hypothetical protein